MAVALYEGYQPVEAAAGATARASTGKRLVLAPGAATSAASAIATASNAGGNAHETNQGEAKFQETLMLRGIKVNATSMVVFEVHMAKPGIAGLPTKEGLVAWGFAPVLHNGQVIWGDVQSAHAHLRLQHRAIKLLARYVVAGKYSLSTITLNNPAAGPGLGMCSNATKEP